MAKSIPYTKGAAERRAAEATERRKRELKKAGVKPCPICRKLEDLVSDHCHASGRDREYICGYCNRGLGLFKDDPEVLRRAAEYLEHHQDLLLAAEEKRLGIVTP